MRYYELKESNAIEHYADMAKEHDLDASDNMAVRKLIETADRVHADCQFYLSQINAGEDNQIAWRGMDSQKYYGTQSILKDVRLNDRTPKDTDESTHDYINREFTKLYGAPFRNALFVSGSVQNTIRYGFPFQIFPVGQFKFIWSPTVNDLWIETQKLHRTMQLPNRSGGEDAMLKNEQLKSQARKEFNEKVLNSYQTTDISDALINRREIMIRVKQYYAVSFDNITNNILDTNKTYPDSYWTKIRAASEEVFYKIVNNK